VAECDRLAALEAELADEFPGFRIVLKPTSAFQRAIHRLLIVVTLGMNRAYLDGYHTTIGRRVYVTSDWDSISRDRRYLVLLHERIHLRQFRRHGLVGMALLYLMVPLPLGLAYFRARFEREAYAESIRGAAALHGVAHVRAPEFRDHILDQFTGPSYGWMWPFRASLERWYDRVLAEFGQDRV
jgi:hypothetical protein